LTGNDWFPSIWVGGLLFIAVIFLAGYLTRGYSHFHQSISELAASNAPYAWLVRWGGFLPLGFSFLLFAHQTRTLFSSFLPSVLFLLIALVVSAAGIFPTDPHNRRDTFSGKIHASSVIALLCLLGIAPFALSFPALYRIPPVDWFFALSFWMGALLLGLLVILPGGDSQITTTSHRKTPEKPIEVWRSLHGLHQRILLSLHTVWWLVFTIVIA
jgi:hypothetical protein